MERLQFHNYKIVSVFVLILSSSYLLHDEILAVLPADFATASSALFNLQIQ